MHVLWLLSLNLVVTLTFNDLIPKLVYFCLLLVFSFINPHFICLWGAPNVSFFILMKMYGMGDNVNFGMTQGWEASREHPILHGEG
jgi:hypothetical protein